MSLVDNKFITIGSQYSAPSSDLDVDFEEWCDHFTTFDDLLLGGDLNTHLTSLGYAREDGRSKILLDFLMSNGLFIINDPEADHTWQVEDRKGRPDLTLGGAGICESIFMGS